MLPVQSLRRAFLGSVVNVIATKLTDDEKVLTKVLKDHDKVLAEGIKKALPVIKDYLHEATKNTSALLRALKL